MQHSELNGRDSESEPGAMLAVGRVPGHPSMTLLNTMNGTSSPKSMTLPHPSSAHYVKQCHSLLEHQRQAFAEERALWNIERQELHERISHMEGTLRRYPSPLSSRVSSPPAKDKSSRNGSRNGFGGSMSPNGSRHSSASSTADEVWRGSNPDIRPTRTFSASTSPPSKANKQLPNIIEHINQDPVRPVPISTILEKINKPTISGSEIDKNLDGINFKTSGLPPEIIKSVMSSGTSSPLQAASPSRLPRGTIRSPPSLLTATRNLNRDPYTVDAGHTPLARHTRPALGGKDASGLSSNTDTPTGSVQEPQLPLEPPATAVKPPSERQDSYFPALEPAQAMECDLDRELKGPLGLTNERSKDDVFLSELDTKLQRAALTKPYGSPPPRNHVANQPRAIPLGDGPDSEEAEDEPKLKIKRSMNFGSQFGASKCGKGF
ncbi:MAG: hypothetical protein Q9163_006343 [Psora crenata]